METTNNQEDSLARLKLVQILILGMTARTDEQMERAVDLAGKFIAKAGLNDMDVARAKREARNVLAR
tara:strand:- start:34 stop:234 length:201 start_codon:yes stop_codon:yes gene_type:complete